MKTYRPPTDAAQASEISALPCRARIPATEKISLSATDSFLLLKPAIAKPRAAMEATPLMIDTAFSNRPP